MNLDKEKTNRYCVLQIEVQQSNTSLIIELVCVMDCWLCSGFNCSDISLSVNELTKPACD